MHDDTDPDFFPEVLFWLEKFNLSGSELKKKT